MGRPYVVGLTGNIATGKSTVLTYLADKGAHVMDADKVAHRTMVAGAAAYPEIVTQFGRRILAEDGEIDRGILGKIVFADKDALRRLEAIVHPQVLIQVQQEMAATSAPVVILEAIKLLESGLSLTLSDEVWVVTAPEGAQLQRLAVERGMAPEEAHTRMAAQSDPAEKVARAHRVICNDGSLPQLYRQLDRIWAEVMVKLGIWKPGIWQDVGQG